LERALFGKATDHLMDEQVMDEQVMDEQGRAAKQALLHSSFT